MNIALWIGQGMLAIVFVASGLLKSTQSKERMMAIGQTGVRDYPLGFIRFIALCELLGAGGLIVPWATGILPILTPLAAIGLSVVLIGAARAHLRLHEPGNVAITLALLALVAFVAFGRLR